MRNHFKVSVLITMLLGLMLSLTGCQFWAQPGKTAQEGTREQIRTLKVNNREMMQDLNHALLLNEPSKLNEMSIPYP
jgi:hypothetical protein